MDSTEQLVTDSTTEQPNEVSDEAAGQSQTFDVNWQTLTGDKLLENYTKLQAEYTKARQEVSETKKNNELSDEDKAAIDFLKKSWFATSDDLEAMQNKQTQDSRLKEIISANPDLKQFESAIREIWTTQNVAYEDVIQKYWFKSKDKLKKAQSQWELKGAWESKTKSISEMSREEYKKHKEKMWWGTSNGTFG